MIATIDLDRTAFGVHVARSRPVGQRVIGPPLVATLWHPIKDAVDPEHLFSAPTIGRIGVVYLAGLVLVEHAATRQVLDFAYPSGRVFTTIRLSPGRDGYSEAMFSSPRKGMILHIPFWFRFLRARNEQAIIENKIRLPFSAERRRAQAQNGINGGSP